MAQKRTYQQRNNYNNNNGSRNQYFGVNKIKSTKNELFVRDLPPQFRSNVTQYKNALSKLSSNKPEQSWINQFDHFKNLSKIEYFGDQSNKAHLDMVEKYLQKINKSYRECNRESTLKLNAKIDSFNKDWVQLHGSVPDIPIEKPKSSSTKDVDPLTSAYMIQLKTLKREHHPIVYAVPGSTNFDYLSTAIRLMNMRRTICFSFDIEAFEFDNNIVTEIGISIYDPRENNHSLVPLTRNYHLVVAEALSLRNKTWVCDYKDCFLLGESLVLPLQQCVEFVQNLIDYYMIPQGKEEFSWSRAFVGHNIKGDIKWLRSIGINFPADNEMDFELSAEEGKKRIHVLDTMKLYSACYGSDGSNLGKILRLFQIPHAYLHNGGNDAHYTLKLLMFMCDINFRKQMGLDDLNVMSSRIHEWIKRGKSEPKILPMSYAVSVADTMKNVQTMENGPENKKRRTKNKELVSQTEFGGSQWFAKAIDAFSHVMK